MSGVQLMAVKRTERGFAGHFICAKDCWYRRNTLLEAGNLRIEQELERILEPDPCA